jgi:hypothetical protein
MLHYQRGLRLRQFCVLVIMVTFMSLVTQCARASTFTTVYSFHSPEKHPTGGLLLASDGNFDEQGRFAGRSSLMGRVANQQVPFDCYTNSQCNPRIAHRDRSLHSD